MDIRISKNDLVRGLSLSHGIADRKATVPILANVLIQTSGKENVSFAATDLKVVLTMKLPARVEEEGGIAVGARQLVEIAKGIAGDEAELKRTEQDWLQLRCGRSEFKIVGMSDKDYPKLPVISGKDLCKVEARVLREMIGRTIFSISQDESRPHLSSVFVESDGEKMTLVSTDGHRLSKATEAMSGGPKLVPGVLLPRKGVGEIRRVLEGCGEHCEIGVEQGYFVVRVDDATLLVKMGEGQFPPYEQVIPKDNDKHVIVSRATLLEVLRRVSIVASDKTWGIRITLEKKKISIEADNPDLGMARETIDVDYQGEKLQIGFNSRYFIELLGEMGGSEVVIELGGDLDPAVVKPVEGEEYVGVIMPMRL